MDLLKLILKPCPFCGEKPRTKGAKYNEMGCYGGKETEKHWYGVYCPECLINQPKRTYFSKEEAVEKWNERKKVNET